jgi:hypothetical protein
MVRQPSFGWSEIAWRWSFGAACWILLIISSFEYLDTLPVTRGDLLLLRTRQPVLISQAIGHIFRGSSWRVVEGLIVLAVGLTIGWIVVAALARATTLRALVAHFRDDGVDQRGNGRRCGFLPLLGLNFLRAATTLAAGIGCVSAFVIAQWISPEKNPEPGAAFLIFLSVLLLVYLAWSATNWVLSLAGVFVVVKDQDAFGSITSSISLVRERTGSVIAAGTWFGLAHIVAFVGATSVVAFPLGLAGLLPAGMVLGGVLLVTLLYFAVADFLYIGRLAAYVGILEIPPAPAGKPVGRNSPEPPSMERGTIDGNELILSDVPGSG